MSGWSALVPQKALARAKGRVPLPAPHRQALAAAMLRDTVAALASTRAVVHTFVLWDAPTDQAFFDSFPGTSHVATPGLGLNGSIEHGAVAARAAFPGCPIVVVPADLPTLRPEELSRCLDRAAAHGRAFVADANGLGTTILTATGDTDLAPAYGPESAAAHAASGAVHLRDADLSSLRHDVDELSSLKLALSAGYGANTVACLAGIASALERTR